MNNEHATEMTQGSFRLSEGTTRLICHVGDMIRFPMYKGQVEEYKDEVISEMEVQIET